ncbi:MAG: MTH938/NDUFAF3 family protein [Nitrospinota bacterium]|nr:MTH938/NDUFAF3 family protein [Nitrospinota bacterium]
MIESYSFGRIVIDGAEYDADVIILPGRVTAGWRRAQGHSLALEDLAPILDNPPELLVIGCGYFGRMKPDPALLDYLRERKITLEALWTKEACAALNQAFGAGINAAGAFHLTC